MPAAAVPDDDGQHRRRCSALSAAQRRRQAADRATYAHPAALPPARSDRRLDVSLVIDRRRQPLENIDLEALPGQEEGSQRPSRASTDDHSPLARAGQQRRVCRRRRCGTARRRTAARHHATAVAVGNGAAAESEQRPGRAVEGAGSGRGQRRCWVAAGHLSEACDRRLTSRLVPPAAAAVRRRCGAAAQRRSPSSGRRHWV